MKINRIVYAEEEIAQLQRQITQFTLQQADVVSKLEESCLSQFTYLNELILAPGLLGNGNTF